MVGREVVEGQWFPDSRRALGLSARRLDEILEGVILTLAAQPKRYPIVAGTTLHTLTTDGFPPHLPSYTIYFNFNAQTVVLEWIEHTDQATLDE